MQGYVVKVTSLGGHAAPLLYYVMCDTEAAANGLMRTTFASERDWAVSALRPVAVWEIDAFGLTPGEVRQVP